MNTRHFSEEELADVLDNVPSIESKPWRHGTREVVVFEWGDAHWRVEVPSHHDEGYVLDGGLVATKVVPYQKTVTAWKPAE